MLTVKANARLQAQGSTSTAQVPITPSNPRETASEPALGSFIKKVACGFSEYREEEGAPGREGKKPHRGPWELILCRWGRTLTSHTGQLYGQELEGMSLGRKMRRGDRR